MSMCGVCGAPATVGSMCGACVARTELLIRDTPGVLVNLDVTTTKQAKQAPPGPGGGGDYLVYNPTASETADELWAALRGFMVPTGRIVYRPTAGEALAAFRATVRHPGTPDRAMRLRDAVQAAYRVVDRAPDRKVIGSCDCGQVLATAKTEGTMTCRSCQRVWDITESLRSRVEDVRERTATPEEAAGLIASSFGVKCTKKMVTHWIDREALTPISEEVRRVRIGDVMDVWEAKHGRLPGRQEAAH